MNATDSSPIVLVVPPFQTVGTPALGVSQLKANLEQAGHPTTILYLNFLYAARIGLPAYEWISERTIEVLLGEYIFSRVLFGDSGRSVAEYVSDILAGSDLAAEMRARFDTNDLVALLEGWITQAGAFCAEEGLQAIIEKSPCMVGVTSSFQQNCAALTLIRSIKRARPDVVTVLGGANTQTEMGEELFARFTEIDHVGQAECDHALVRLVDSLRDEQTPVPVPGILSRALSAKAPPAPPLTGQQLDELPHPDFHDYFAQFAQCGFADDITHSLVMETSRGCWWGAKHHCTFCGLNGEGMGFRSKSPARALEEFASLVTEYGVPRIAVADNILDMKYFRTVLPTLAAGPTAGIFYETKANLTRDQVRLLARSRIRWIQPGIESFSDKTLRLMRKGCSKLQNIQLLKWCFDDGIFVGWNFLYGFPGEDRGEAPTLAEEIESVHHLQPPSNVNIVRIDRFSPYYNDAAGFGLTGVRPFPVYAYVYPFPAESLRRLAYFFDCDHALEMQQAEDFKIMERAVARWKTAHRFARLLAIPRRRSLIVIDTRGCRTRLLHRLTGLRREVLEHCEQIHSGQEIARHFAPAASAAAIAEIVAQLVADRLMLAADDRYLGITTRLGERIAPFAPKPRRSAGLRRRRLVAEVAAVMTLRVPPARAVRALARRLANRASAFRLRLFNRTLTVLARLLSQEQAPVAAAKQRAVSPR